MLLRPFTKSPKDSERVSGAKRDELNEPERTNELIRTPTNVTRTNVSSSCRWLQNLKQSVSFRLCAMCFVLFGYYFYRIYI